LRAKRGASINADACILARSVRRSSDNVLPFTSFILGMRRFTGGGTWNSRSQSFIGHGRCQRTSYSFDSPTLCGVPGIAPPSFQPVAAGNSQEKTNRQQSYATYRARSNRAICREGDSIPDTVSAVAHDLNNGNGVTRVFSLRRRLTHPAAPDRASPELIVDPICHHIQLSLPLLLRISEQPQLPLSLGELFGRHANQPHRLEWPLVEQTPCRFPKLLGRVGGVGKRR